MAGQRLGCMGLMPPLLGQLPPGHRSPLSDQASEMLSLILSGVRCCGAQLKMTRLPYLAMGRTGVLLTAPRCREGMHKPPCSPAWSPAWQPLASTATPGPSISRTNPDRYL